MKKENPSHPPVLTIAGSDSSGGAGIQADLKTMTSLGCYGMTVITALTAQNTMGVQGVFPIPSSFVLDQLQSIFDDIPPAAVKIGMLHNRHLIEAVAGFLESRKIPIVLDPVMVATSGDPLLQSDALKALQDCLFPLAALITPNVYELSLISSETVQTAEDLAEKGLQVTEHWGLPFLVKGGDLHGAALSSDVLIRPGKPLLWLKGDRIQTKNTHGTGCTLSSAIAAYLALGWDLETSIRRSKKYITTSLLAGKVHSWGRGRGSVNHMWNIQGVYDDSHS